MFYRKKQRMNVIQSNKEQAVSSRTFLKSEINNISQKIIVIKDMQTYNFIKSIENNQNNIQNYYGEK